MGFLHPLVDVLNHYTQALTTLKVNERGILRSIFAFSGTFTTSGLALVSRV